MVEQTETGRAGNRNYFQNQLIEQYGPQRVRLGSRPSYMEHGGSVGPNQELW